MSRWEPFEFITCCFHYIEILKENQMDKRHFEIKHRYHKMVETVFDRRKFFPVLRSIYLIQPAMFKITWVR